MCWEELFIVDFCLFIKLSQILTVTPLFFPAPSDSTTNLHLLSYSTSMIGPSNIVFVALSSSSSFGCHIIMRPVCEISHRLKTKSLHTTIPTSSSSSISSAAAVGFLRLIAAAFSFGWVDFARAVEFDRAMVRVS